MSITVYTASQYLPQLRFSDALDEICCEMFGTNCQVYNVPKNIQIQSLVYMLLRFIMACAGLEGTFYGYRTGLEAFLVPHGNALIHFLYIIMEVIVFSSFFESGDRVILFRRH